ncbi:hypothetical protein LAZ67_18001375 [Cordylochernes scorpioides]|uniref:Uncharacterized protein n=1 Tax=Cordylochernes scorpioides TaxID=51811 RepID=A0ABY6LG20_9ARAC|nr:hypothetical protein LAZ67_18001375 [Cordylochernes scorpioides]
MSSGTAVPTSRGPMGRLSIIPGHQGGEGFAESGRRGELRSLMRINSGLGVPTDDQKNSQPFLRTVTEVECSAIVVSTAKLRGPIHPHHHAAPYRVTSTRAHVTCSPDPLYTTNPA